MGFLKRSITAFLALSFLAFSQKTQADLALEYQVKCAYVFNFARFVEWPASAFPSAESPLIVGLAGNNKFTEALRNSLRGRIVENRPLVIKEVTDSDQASKVHILAFGNPDAAMITALLQKVGGRPVLTVSDADGFLDMGGMIQLKLKGDKVQFSVNLPTVDQSGLKISSQMMQYAEIKE